MEEFLDLKKKFKVIHDMGKIKSLRRNRSQPEFKIILSEENFNKKLNEYNNNNINYSRNDAENNLIFAKSLVNFSFKDNKFIPITEGNYKIINIDSKNKFISELENDLVKRKGRINN